MNSSHIVLVQRATRTRSPALLIGERRCWSGHRVVCLVRDECHSLAGIFDPIGVCSTKSASTCQCSLFLNPFPSPANGTRGAHSSSVFPDLRHFSAYSLLSSYIREQRQPQTPGEPHGAAPCVSRGAEPPRFPPVGGPGPPYSPPARATRPLPSSSSPGNSTPTPPAICMWLQYSPISNAQRLHSGSGCSLPFFS